MAYYSELIPPAGPDLPRSSESEGRSMEAVKALLSFLRLRLAPAEVTNYEYHHRTKGPYIPVLFLGRVLFYLSPSQQIEVVNLTLIRKKALEVY